MNAAVKEGLINDTQASKLWNFWENKQQHVPTFRFSHMLYYLGGMIAISAVTLFITNAWDKLRGGNMLMLSIFLLLLGLSLTHNLLRSKAHIPAGIMATFSLALVPLAVYNLQIMLGYFPDKPIHYRDFNYLINWCWLIMEFATILAGVIMIYFYRTPFLLFPISVVLWYMSMDLYPFLFSNPAYIFNSADYRANFSTIFGIFMLLAAIGVDLKSESRKDYAFWLYIFGVITFWGGLTCHQDSTEFSRFIYCTINFLLIFLGVLLNRRVFAVFGAIGILIYLQHLAYVIFKDSLSFPVILVLFGILIIFAAMAYARIEKRMHAALKPYIPKKIADRM
jgi:hypothetical protein